MKLAWLVLALALATPARAGDDCHVSAAVPHITDFRVTAEPGAVLVDARIDDSRGDFLSTYTPNACYIGTCWTIAVGVGTFLDLSGATLTDSTFHARVPHAPGTFDLSVCVYGKTAPDEADACGCAVEIDGETLTVPPDPTPALRASWGAVRARWGR